MEMKHKIVAGAVGVGVLLVLIITVSVLVTRKSSNPEEETPSYTTTDCLPNDLNTCTIILEECGTLIHMVNVTGKVKCTFYKDKPRTKINERLVLSPGNYFVYKLNGNAEFRNLYDFEMVPLIKYVDKAKMTVLNTTQTKYKVETPPKAQTRDDGSTRRNPPNKGIRFDSLEFIISDSIPMMILFRDIDYQKRIISKESLSITVKFTGTGKEDMLLISLPGFYEVSKGGDGSPHVTRWSKAIYDEVVTTGRNPSEKEAFENSIKMVEAAGAPRPT